MLFFTVLCTFFGMALNVLSQNLQPEYGAMSKATAGIFSALRISIGDFDFTQLEILTKEENQLYWVVWGLVFLMGCLIFLNFIIAEVGESYGKVKEDLEALIYSERSKMVKEAEDFFTDHYKATNKEYFPNFIVVRESDQ